MENLRYIKNVKYTLNYISDLRKKEQMLCVIHTFKVFLSYFSILNSSYVKHQRIALKFIPEKTLYLKLLWN